MNISKQAKDILQYCDVNAVVRIDNSTYENLVFINLQSDLYAKEINDEVFYLTVKASSLEDAIESLKKHGINEVKLFF